MTIKIPILRKKQKEPNTFLKKSIPNKFNLQSLLWAELQKGEDVYDIKTKKECIPYRPARTADYVRRYGRGIFGRIFGHQPGGEGTPVLLRHRVAVGRAAGQRMHFVPISFALP
jgi:hypothetical protein